MLIKMNINIAVVLFGLIHFGLENRAWMHTDDKKIHHRFCFFLSKQITHCYKQIYIYIYIYKIQWLHKYSTLTLSGKIKVNWGKKHKFTIFVTQRNKKKQLRKKGYLH